MGTEENTKADVKKSTVAIGRYKMVIGGLAVLAVGILAGFVFTRYEAGIPPAEAATAKDRPIHVAISAKDLAARHEWNPFQEIRDMQLHMDQMFDRMTTEFRTEPRLGLFADNPGYSLSMHVQDLKDHYEVRAYLPDAKASDVKVSLIDKQTLKVEVTNTETANPKNATVTEWGQYAEIIQLPSPVKNEQMKVDNQSHQLLITLPKA